MLHHLLNLSPQSSLLLLSSLGGALFVALWFLIVYIEGTPLQAWILGLSLAFAPVTWLTSTQVLTDSPGSALITLTLLLFILFKRTNRWTFAFFGSIVGGLTVGCRPQFIIPVAVITLYFLAKTTLSNRKIITITVTFLLTCLVWLIPTMVLQARRPLNNVGWKAYPSLLHRQWQWRMDKEEVYLGTGKTTFKRIAKRVMNHWGGWITRSLALTPVSPITTIGLLIFMAGIILAFIPRLPHPPPFFPFWKANLFWTIPYIFVILFSLPPNRRYYLPILPLLLLLSIRGWAGLKKPYRFGIILLPVILFRITLPLVLESHRELAPPILMLNTLKMRYLIQDRPGVLLLLSDTYRHAQYYAPGFTIKPTSLFSLEESDALSRFTAMYTDSPNLVKRRWHDVRFKEMGQWRRSPLIHDKHTREVLWKILPGIPLQPSP